MKMSIKLIILLSFCTIIWSQENLLTFDDFTIICDDKNSFSIRDDIQKIIQVLGEPLSRSEILYKETIESCFDLIKYSYTGISVFHERNSDSICMFKINKLGRFKTNRSIAVGDSVDIIVKTYGTPTHNIDHYENGIHSVKYLYLIKDPRIEPFLPGDLYISFKFIDNHLNSFSIYESDDL